MNSKRRKKKRLRVSAASSPPPPFRLQHSSMSLPTLASCQTSLSVATSHVKVLLLRSSQGGAGKTARLGWRKNAVASVSESPPYSPFPVKKRLSDPLHAFELCSLGRSFSGTKKGHPLKLRLE